MKFKEQSDGKMSQKSKSISSKCSYTNYLSIETGDDIIDCEKKNKKIFMCFDLHSKKFFLSQRNNNNDNKLLFEIYFCYFYSVAGFYLLYLG